MKGPRPKLRQTVLEVLQEGSVVSQVSPLSPELYETNCHTHMVYVLKRLFYLSSFKALVGVDARIFWSLNPNRISSDFTVRSELALFGQKKSVVTVRGLSGIESQLHDSVFCGYGKMNVVSLRFLICKIG